MTGAHTDQGLLEPLNHLICGDGEFDPIANLGRVENGAISEPRSVMNANGVAFAGYFIHPSVSMVAPCDFAAIMAHVEERPAASEGGLGGAHFCDTLQAPMTATRNAEEKARSVLEKPAAETLDAIRAQT